MIVFVHKSGAYIAVNTKGLSSFFTIHPDCCQLHGTVPPLDYVICRNPYARAVSLFEHKMRRGVLQGEMQMSQRLLMVALGLMDVKKLLECSFEQMVRVLPLLLQHDGHFYPQSKDFPGAKEAVKIETDLPAFGAKLGIDFSPKVNATVHGPWQGYYTPELARLLVDTYRKDFEVFGYSTEIV